MHIESFETKHHFKKKSWSYHNGSGGGEIALLRGNACEKGAVNFSHIKGNKLPFSDKETPFEACGVSLILHMNNPYAPTTHMNIRYLKTEEKDWFGGGYDISPMGFPFEEDASHFHMAAKKALDPHGKDLYENFSQNAKEYFFIPHRKKERGQGGIFFDHYRKKSLKEDFAMVADVGTSFIDATLPILQKRIHQPYKPEDKVLQAKLRAHYVEFNLLYDRGTKFGFLSGGNPEAILCSMPPSAAW